MADGSKVHKKLGWRYQTTYKRVCEGAHSAEDIAQSLVQHLTKDVKDYGSLPISLLREVADMLEPATEEPLFMRRNDWVTIEQWIEQAAQQVHRRYAQDGNRKSRVGIEAAKRACEQHLVDTRRGKPRSEGGMLQNLLEKYLINIHRINFTDKVPLNPEHYGGVAHETVALRLDNITPQVERHVPALAKQMLNEERDIRTIRTPSRSTPRPGVDIDTEIAV
jgi:hypothetical protein